MKKLLVQYLFLTMLGSFACTHKEVDDEWGKLIENEAKAAAEQYKYLFLQTPKDRMPRTFYPQEAKLESSSTSWWTSGFFPGTLFYIYELTGDQKIYDLGVEKLEILAKEQHNKGTHDLGFMLYCSFGNADRLNPNDEYKNIMLTGAESLASRYNEDAQVIRSWDHGKWQFPVIIDNMMNLEFLFWASEQSGDPKYKDIAIKHSNQTIKNHFRDDNSSYHVIDYDPTNGEVLARETAQGLHNESAWSRGQSWALYGYTTMYRLTKDEAYLNQAKAIAEFIFSHPNLPEDLIPFWDFDITEQAEEKRDVSAATINASALLELAKYVFSEQADDYVDKAKIILKNLSSDAYRANENEIGGFLLKHSVGHFKANSEVDVPLTYADYYYIEALLRLKNWH